MPTYINIPIYKDYDIFRKTGLTLNETQNFEELNDPIFQALNAYTMFKTNKDFKYIRICIIDELYLEWLAINNKEKNKESIVTYITDMTDDTARNLWVKYKLCESIDIMSITFYVPTDELKETSNYRLNNDESIKIKDLICNNLELNKEDVHVPGYITTFVEATNREEDLQLIAREYFESGTKVVFGLLEEQSIDKRIGITTFCIPIMYKMKIDCIFTKEIIEDMLENDKLIKPINFEPVEELLKSKFENPVILVDRLVLVCELQEIYTSFLIALQKKMKKLKLLSLFKIKKKRD